MGLLKPRWAYVWEYGLMSHNEMLRTPVALTAWEFEMWINRDEDGPIPFLNHKRPLEETRVDRNQVPLRCPGFTMKLQMPEHDAPNSEELRALWAAYPDGDVRALILEVLALRKGLNRVQEWFQEVDDSKVNKGELGAGNGALQRLRHLLRKERERACLE